MADRSIHTLTPTQSLAAALPSSGLVLPSICSLHADGVLDVVKYYVEEVGTPINEKMAVGGDGKPVGTVNIAHASCAYAEPAILDYALSKDPWLLNHADPSNRLPLQW